MSTLARAIGGQTVRIQVARLRERQVGESLKCFKGDLRGRLKKGNLQQVVGLKGALFFFKADTVAQAKLGNRKNAMGKWRRPA